MSVFVSYKSEDRAHAKAIASHLETFGYDVFWDNEVRNGEAWDDRLRAEVSNAAAVVVLWSARAAASENVRHECQIARQTGAYIPAMIEELQPADLPMGAAGAQMAKLFLEGAPREQELAKLVAAVQAKVLARAPSWLKRMVVDVDVSVQRDRNLRDAAEAKAAALAREARRYAAARIEAQHAARVLEDELAETRRDHVRALARLEAAEQEIATLNGELAGLAQRPSGGLRLKV